VSSTLSDLVRKALMIGEDADTRISLGQELNKAGIELVRAVNGSAGLKAFYSERPDVVVLDLELPDADGFEVLRTVRELSDVPVFALTGRMGEAERVRALRAGADDCLSRPASEEEMIARIEALLRRSHPREIAPVIEDEFIHIDHTRHRVAVLGNEVDLTPIEFRMLSTFAENPGLALSHGQLLDMVWGDRIRERDEVKLYVSYLRRKLAEAAAIDPVETVRGVGYRYRPRRLERASD
jgi:DNA-binding response OmpR family regulator